MLFAKLVFSSSLDFFILPLGFEYLRLNIQVRPPIRRYNPCSFRFTVSGFHTFPSTANTFYSGPNTAPFQQFKL